MAKSLPVMARVSPEIKKRLKALAKTTKRSESYLAREAIEAFVELNEWQVGLIKEGLEALQKGEASIPHEEVKAWLASKGSRRKRPIPKPRQR